MDSECSLYTGSDKDKCESIIPKTDTYANKCVYKEGSCISEPKNSCDDYKLGQITIIVLK